MLTTILKLTGKRYYNDLLQRHKGSVKESWNILNKIMKKNNSHTTMPRYFVCENNKQVINRKEIANGFNNFFANIGPNLANQIKITDNTKTIYDYLNNSEDKSIFLEPVVDKEVLNTVKNYKSKTSTYCDNLDMAIIKKIINSVAKTFTYMCNLSFLNGIIPDKMKIAKIIPLFKAGNKSQFTNYRPVSLLPQFSKILEKLFNNRLNNIIEKNNILSDPQYSFRNNRSTSLALMDLIEQITDNLDNKKTTIGIFIDLKKAFDTVNHELLLEKLKFYGVRGIANRWLQNYLEDRKQYVSFNYYCSELSKVSCGVPQG